MDYIRSLPGGAAVASDWGVLSRNLHDEAHIEPNSKSIKIAMFVEKHPGMARRPNHPRTRCY